MRIELKQPVLRRLAADTIRKYHPELVGLCELPVCKMAKGLIRHLYPAESRKQVKRRLCPASCAAFYQGFLWNYVVNEGRIVPPVQGLYFRRPYLQINLEKDCVSVVSNAWGALNLVPDVEPRFFAPSRSKDGYGRKKAQALYQSEEWRALRYEVLRAQNGCCQLCGRSRKDGVVLHVDHIVPLSKDWSMRLDKNNLQVLCADCNIGKSNKDGIDWR